ncbi:hypothetical protein COT97_02150 [Candidatus Falkowbacteria bacterium CG10_big_fil_rev_8_21_14_0_10_39_11]|uniref:Uncharacterized protein n=1 Tax=Candidatus Falkowbacteria bacterium CG10_big_fil_rev_8_21_14_0_10_39_11 TaxID=1974565 RepID=A0A2H0V5D0_9BACT|nr:MAG: hypothetical protein COT97_02150 [Candidatus Falkowbacteria bacterium CG10_big_fil_rev_8_21_14_0_10_39_11]
MIFPMVFANIYRYIEQTGQFTLSDNTICQKLCELIKNELDPDALETFTHMAGGDLLPRFNTNNIAITNKTVIFVNYGSPGFSTLLTKYGDQLRRAILAQISDQS